MSYQSEFLKFLQEEYASRRKKNPRYSLRSFSKHLGIDQSQLSKYLRGKINLSPLLILKALEEINAPAALIQQFHSQILAIHSDYDNVEDATLTILSDWKYWMLLEYLKIERNVTKSQFHTLLKLSPLKVRKMMKLLEKSGFIEITNNIVKFKKPNNLWISHEKTTGARKKLQRDLLRLSLKALDKIEFEERWHSSLTVAIDSRKLPEF